MDNVIMARDEYRAENWALIIKDCAASGLTNKAYCQQHGISEKSYYYWLHKIRKQACEQTGPQIVAIEPTPSEKDECLKIEFKGAELKLPAGVDMNAVAALLTSLQSI